MTANPRLTVRAGRTTQTAAQPRRTPAAARGGDRSPAVQPVRQVFGGTPDQVAQARVFTRKVLGPVPVLDEVVLLVSELCANAVLHTASGDGGSFEVAIWPGPSQVRVEVRDEGSEQEPAISPVTPASTTGRGLQLVAALAERWGYGGDRDERVVFFQMRW
jgi:anti-sigma regulatory factor (Ser/Thr protein kinase)